MKKNIIVITGGAVRMRAAIARKLSGPNKEILIHYNKSKLKAEKLKKEKRLKALEERKLKEEEEKKKQTGKNIAKIFRFTAQLIIAALLVLIIIYAIF